MANYLVTGAAGFIGARVSEMLIESGHAVVGVDNMNDAYDVRMKEYRLRKLQMQSRFEFLRDDISDKQILNRHSPLLTTKFEAVINLAARAGVRASVENPWVFYEANVTGTLNMLELCRQRAIPKFLMASTSSIYGANPPYPTPETASTDMPLQPYAASKKAAETLSYTYHYLHGIDVSVVRYFTVYGPAGRPDLAIFRFVQWITEGRPVQLYGDGEQSRGFTYVDDIARGTIAALQSFGYETINLGGHEVIINNLVKLIEEITGKKATIDQQPPNPAEMMTNWADVSKAKDLLGWKPQMNMRQGVERLVEWYNTEREWAKEVLTP
jgi:UDP-glucuronate 4-epimerase